MKDGIIRIAIKEVGRSSRELDPGDRLGRMLILMLMIDVGRGPCLYFFLMLVYTCHLEFVPISIVISKIWSEIIGAL